MTSQSYTESYLKMMEAWLDASKTCAQLAMAALFLPIFFNRQVLGQKEGVALDISNWHVACWVTLAFSIGFALFYQLTVARLVQGRLTDTDAGALFPRLQFWAMVLLFLLGIGFFVAGVVTHG